MSSWGVSHTLKREKLMKEKNDLHKLGSFLLWLLVATSILILYTLHFPHLFKFVHPMVQNVEEDDGELTIIKSTKKEESCDLFVGKWIRDPGNSGYINSSCPTIPDSKNCGRHGRTDEDYTHWRWRPNDCRLPRFNPKIFLNIVRGKKLAFIGDSVARNHMESLLCLLSQAETPKDIYRDNGDRFITWYFPVHDFTIMVLWTRFLVQAEERIVNGTNSGVFDIYLDKLDRQWTYNLSGEGADYVIISSGHWFFRKCYLHHGNTIIGCIFCNEKDVPELGLSYGLRMSFRKSLEFINDCDECNVKLSLVRTFSPAHFEGGAWNGGGYCNRTQPLNENDVNLSGLEMEINRVQLEEMERAKIEGRKKGRRFDKLEVTRVMLMRADGHPDSHWNNQFMRGYRDCVHWCLPGPIDTWNELLMVVIRREYPL